MDNLSVEQRVIEIVKKNVPWKADAVKLESKLIEDLGVQSIDKISIVMDIEQNFRVTIKEEALAGINTIGDIVERVSAIIDSENVAK